jgi:hypothetical protein
LLGEPPTPRGGAESNVAAFVFRPRLTAVPGVANVQGAGADPRSADVTVQLDPVVGRSQRVLLLLNEVTAGPPGAYTFLAKPRNADGNAVTIRVTGVKAATYLVRVQVDGAESPLIVDTNPASPTFNRYIGPTVAIP